MSYTQAIISGIIQGLTEFLPVSSSGHLVILHNYFGFKEPQIMLSVFLHVATLFAVIAYFRKDIISIFRKDRKFLLAVIIGTIPTALIGYFFKDIFESLFANITLVGIMLYVTAVLLFLADAFAGNDSIAGRTRSPGMIKAFFIGIAQGISIIPGISRSGATISTGMLLRIDREMAVKFSFLLSIPAILGALCLKLPDMQGGIAYAPQMLAGMFFAFVFGLGAIYILIKAAIRGKLKFFAFYCLIAGTAAIIKGFIG
jgi:undecaprenyl-diphosphatase